MSKQEIIDKIKGIGEAIADVLENEGIDTLEELATTKDSELRAILEGAGMPVSEDEETGVQTWSHQAKVGIFTRIGGITDAIAEALIQVPIDTLAKLARLSDDKIRSFVNATNGGVSVEDVEAWRAAAQELRRSGSTGSRGASGGSGSGSSGSGGSGSGSSGSSGGGSSTSTAAGRRPMFEPIVFGDIRDRNVEERDRLLNERFILRRRKEEMGALQPVHQNRLDEISVLLFGEKDAVVLEDATVDSRKVFDALYIAIQAEFSNTGQEIGDHEQGKLSSQQDDRPTQRLVDDEIAFAAVYGILEREHTTNPELGQRFSNALALARGEYNGRKDLYHNVLEFLIQEGDLPNDPRDRQDPNPEGRFVVAEQWALVIRALVNQGIKATDIHLGLKTRQALASQVATDDSTPPSSLEIDLPDLEEQSDVEIVEDNLHAMQAIYFAAMLEDLKLFQVVEKLVELFQIGMLPVGKGRAGDILFRYMKKSVTRFSEYERQNLYARTLGSASGEASGNPNRDFQILWLRFVSSVSSFARQMQVDSLLRANIPIRVSQEQVRKAGRDLAANLSLYGYGMAYHAATELQNQINEVVTLLSDAEIKGAYGARDMWGVIDQVAALELGGARDSVRYRTMASAGAVIIRWLANRSKMLSSVNMVEVLDVNEISRPNPRSRGSKATTDPYDSDLINACERWLAVTGTPDAQVETYADPYEGPATTSRPIQIPAAARDLLQSVGINPSSLGTVGNGYRR